MFSSTLLLLALLVLSADGRSTSPWNRRLPSLASTTPSTSASASNNLMLPLVRGGESSTSSSSNTALPTPASSRIRDNNEEDERERESNEANGYTTINPNVIGGHSLRAGGKVDSLPDGTKATNATDPNVVVEVSVKATKKLLKAHKQIAKKLRVRIILYRNVPYRIELHHMRSTEGIDDYFPLDLLEMIAKLYLYRIFSLEDKSYSVHST